MRIGSPWLCLGLAAAFAVSAGAHAQTAASKSERIRGNVESITGDRLTVDDAQGTSVQLQLAPDWRVSVVAPISVDAIQPGSFIGTTNMVQPDGTGRSVEVHVFPPGLKTGEGDRVMDETTGAKMTNGTVGQVVRSAGTAELDVASPGGQRHIVVPADVPIMSMTPGERDLVKPGIPVTVVAMQGTDGTLAARFVLVGVDGAAPPT